MQLKVDNNATQLNFKQLEANECILVQVPRHTSLSPSDYWLSSRCDLFPSFQGSFALMKSLRYAMQRFYHLRSSFAILGAVLAPVLLPVPADVVRGFTYIPYSRNLGRQSGKCSANGFYCPIKMVG